LEAQVDALLPLASQGTPITVGSGYTVPNDKRFVIETVTGRATGLAASIVMHDRDTKFTASFDRLLKSANLDVKKTAHCSPNTAAYVERFIQTLQQECLDYFIVFGPQHMDHLVSEMVTHYHQERPHQAKDNKPLLTKTATVSRKSNRRKKDPQPPDAIPVTRIKRRQRLGGLLKHYFREAA